jgi:hypothetical protein
MVLIQADDRAQAQALGVPIETRRLGVAELTAALDGGALAIVLISSYRLYGERWPHWVLVHGHDGRRVYVHDSWIDDEYAFDTAATKANLPIPYAEFERMATYGKRRLGAAILVRPGGGDRRA